MLRAKSKKNDGGQAPPEPTINTSVARLSKDGKRPQSPAAATSAHTALQDVHAPAAEASEAPTNSSSTDLAAVRTAGPEQKPAGVTKQDGQPQRQPSAEDQAKSALGSSKPRKPSGDHVSSIVASIEKGTVSNDAGEPEPAPAAAAHVAASGTKHDRSDSPKAPATVQEELQGLGSGRVDSKGHLVKKPKQEGEDETHAEEEQESRVAAPPVASEAPASKAEPQPKVEIEKAAPPMDDTYTAAAPDAAQSSEVEARAPKPEPHVKAEAGKSAPAEVDGTVATKEEVTSGNQVEEDVSAVREGADQAEGIKPEALGNVMPEDVAVKDLVEKAFVKDFVETAFKNAVSKVEAELKAASGDNKGAEESPERKVSPSTKGGSNKSKNAKKASGSSSSPARSAGKKPKPNDPCPCGRYFPAKKYKKCCGQGGY